jgi:hypothetical protein
MATKPTISVIIALLVAALACGGGDTQGPDVQATIDAAVRETQTAGSTPNPVAPSQTGNAVISEPTSAATPHTTSEVSPPADGFYFVEGDKSIALAKTPLCFVGDNQLICTPKENEDIFKGIVRTAPSTTNNQPVVLLKSSSISVAKVRCEKITGTIGVALNLGGPGHNNVVGIVLPNTGAEAAGLRSGDAILAVDGNDLTNVGIDEKARKLLRGEYGSKAELTVLQGTSTVELTVVRNIFAPTETCEFSSAIKTDYAQFTPNQPLTPAMYCFFDGTGVDRFCFRVNR